MLELLNRLIKKSYSLSWDDDGGEVELTAGKTPMLLGNFQNWFVSTCDVWMASCWSD